MPNSEDLQTTVPSEPTRSDNLPQALECLLFAAKEPVALVRLAEVLQVEQTELPGLLEQLDDLLSDRGLQLAKLAGGYTLATRPEYSAHVQRLLQPDPERLSLQALETLAIIAYRQPMTRPEVEEVRGVNSSGTITSLLEKDLIRIAGRRDAPGRPFLLETTPRFLSIFGLSDLAELPEIGELQRRLDQQLPILAHDDQGAVSVADALDDDSDPDPVVDAYEGSEEASAAQQ